MPVDGLSRELLWLFSGDGKRVVVCLQAFMDESGTHDGSGTLSVAAMVGIRAEWELFLSKWGQKYFHAKESKCDSLKPELFDAIQYAKLWGFNTWTNPADYRAKTSHQFRSVMGNAYAVSTYVCAIGVCKFARKNNLGKVAFVIEDGQPNAGWVREVLEALKDRGNFGIASIALASKRDFVQLATADFFSHAKTNEPDWFKRMCATKRVKLAPIEPSFLEDISDDVVRDLRRLKHQKTLLKAKTRLDARIARYDIKNAKGKTPQ